MRAATASLLSALPPLPVGWSATASSRPARDPSCPPVCLCISAPPRAHRPTSPETPGRVSPSACWKAGGAGSLPGPAFPPVSGTLSERAGLDPSLLEPSGSPPASSWAAAPPARVGLSAPCLLVPSPQPVWFPSHAG